MNRLAQQQCFHKLNSLLQRQFSEIEGLNAYFDDLKSAISTGDSKELNQLISQQRLPTAEFEEFEDQRVQLLEHYGFEADKDSLLACIDWCDQGGILENDYLQLEQALQRLQHSVQLNHLLVNKSQKHVRQSLHLLTRQAITDSTSTYSSTGSTEELSSRRSLAQA